MPFCPSCGGQVQFGDAGCGSCGETLPEKIARTAAATQSATAPSPLPQDWASFTCWDGSFSLKYPADWQPQSPPVSEDASLSCVGPDGFTLLEAFGLQNDHLRGRDLVKMMGDGIVQTLGQEEGHANGRLRDRRAVAFHNAEGCERVVVSCTDQGLETTTDYFMVGSGRNAVLLALKVLSPEYERRLPLYEQIIQSLEVTWLSAPAGPRRAPPPRPVPPPITIAPAARRPLPEPQNIRNLPTLSSEPMPQGKPLIGWGLVLAGLAVVAGGLWYWFWR